VVGHRFYRKQYHGSWRTRTADIAVKFVKIKSGTGRWGKTTSAMEAVVDAWAVTAANEKKKQTKPLRCIFCVPTHCKNNAFWIKWMRNKRSTHSQAEKSETHETNQQGLFQFYLWQEFSSAVVGFYFAKLNETRWCCEVLELLNSKPAFHQKIQPCEQDGNRRVRQWSFERLYKLYGMHKYH